MEPNFVHSTCPVCDGNVFSTSLETKDYFLTQEPFFVVDCQSCGFRFTNPIPAEDKIGSYYKSDNYVSHSSSKKGFVNRVYNTVRTYTLKQKVTLIQKRAKGSSLLDIGAGTAHFLNQAKLHGFQVEGLEPDSDAVSFAKQYFQIDLKPLANLTSFDDASFDVITMWHVLEHVYHLQRDLEVITRKLKRDGVFIVAVPNIDSHDAKHYGPFWAALDVPRHLYHFQKSTISLLMERYGMELTEVLPMKFDSYYVSMLSEKYKGGNLLKAFFRGFLSNLNAKKGGYSSQIYIFRFKNAF